MKSETGNKTIITLPCYGVLVTLDETMVGFGSIQSTLGCNGEPEMDSAENAIESLILAHAVAGVQIDCPAYVEGIETAVDACCNN